MAEVEPLDKRSLAIREKGPDHPHVASTTWRRLGFAILHQNGDVFFSA